MGSVCRPFGQDHYKTERRKDPGTHRSELAGECPTGGPVLPPMIPELVAMRLRTPAQQQSQTARTSRPELQQRPAPTHGPCR
ncbi:hypothetical protein KUCAC02_030580 [Chaenocephalus aceratus]|uniref:Uncharacterized protein n=1 Tax=Chaenocephalus aceratus TaxID=36190 RepID=A0ACB9XKH2_CHAAC|nr:hypothetical protein KUCAC02_030580 [Chaenocephalus aceratus]